MVPMQGKLASSQIDFGYTEQFCIPGDICHQVTGLDVMILVFWMLSLKPNFFTLLFHFHQEAFSSSSLFAIRVVSSACLRLLAFLLAILIPACAPSSPAFFLMYSVYKLNKQGDNIQPWHIPFPIWNQSVVPCPVLTVGEPENKELEILSLKHLIILHWFQDWLPLLPVYIYHHPLSSRPHVIHPLFHMNSLNTPN